MMITHDEIMSYGFLEKYEGDDFTGIHPTDKYVIENKFGKLIIDVIDVVERDLFGVPTGKLNRVHGICFELFNIVDGSKPSEQESYELARMNEIYKILKRKYF